MSERAVHARTAWKAVAAVVLLAACIRASAAELPEVTLGFGPHKLTAEVANTDATRSTGLMHRRMLPENRGMLFILPDVAIHGMWMMNTYLPLSVAFLDANGVIINMADLPLHTQDSHNATPPPNYASEL